MSTEYPHYAITRRNNQDSKNLERLKHILADCKRFGHKPADDSDDARVLRSTDHQFRMRQRKNQHIPTENITLLNQILEFPTQRQHAKTNDAAIFMRARAASPHIKLLQALVSADAYKRLTTTPVDKFGLHLLSDYVDSVFYSVPDVEQRVLAHTFGLTPKDKAEQAKWRMGDEVLSKNANNVITIKYTARALGLTIIRINSLKQRAITRLRDNVAHHMAEMLNHLFNNRIDAMIDLMPQQYRNMYRFQRKYNMGGMNTDNLISAGGALAKLLDAHIR